MTAISFTHLNTIAACGAGCDWPMAAQQLSHIVETHFIIMIIIIVTLSKKGERKTPMLFWEKNQSFSVPAKLMTCLQFH